jgi:secreted Zn-dependent insulinase-like peptidase
LTLRILKGALPAYEEYHKLTVDETVMSDAIRLAKRYLTEKSLPDSAFDLIDRTMAQVKTMNDLTGSIIEELRTKLEDIKGRAEGKDAADESLMKELDWLNYEMFNKVSCILLAGVDSDTDFSKIATIKERVDFIAATLDKLTSLNAEDHTALKSDDLIALFYELQQYECEYFYCGRQPIDDVASVVLQTLNLRPHDMPYIPADTYRPLQQYTEPTVFFYNVPKSRQNYVVSYDAISALPSVKERAQFKLWDEYFGGNMSSILFQNVREFRSLAYSTSGYSTTTSRALHPQEPQGYITATGTQADKTLEALATIDSLLRQMPMKEENLEAARQTVLNDIQNAYPTFRTIGKYIANKKRDGYTTDPDAEIARVIPTLSAKDIEQFHQQHVGSNSHRVWIVIGDKKRTDMKALARFGKVVELKKEDIYR